MTTWNPADTNGRVTLTNGDLGAVREGDISSGDHWATGRATDYKSSGKWLYATRPLSVGDYSNASLLNKAYLLTGFANVDQSIADNVHLNSTNDGVSSYHYDGNILGDTVVKLVTHHYGLPWTFHAIDIDARLYWSAQEPYARSSWDWRYDYGCSQYVRFASNERLSSNILGFATDVWRLAHTTTWRYDGDGLLYFEVTPSTGGGVQKLVGLVPADFVGIDNDYPGNGADRGICIIANGAIFQNNAVLVTGDTYTATEAVGVCVNLDTAKVWFRATPTSDWNASATADPETGVEGFDLNFTGPVKATVGHYHLGDMAANFGASAFEGIMPTGAQAWDNANNQVVWNDDPTADPGAGTGGVDVSYMTGDLVPAFSLLEAPDEILANFGFSGFPLPLAMYPTGFDTWEPGVTSSTGRRARGGTIAM